MPMRNFRSDWVDDRCSCRQLQHGPRWSTSGNRIPKKYRQETYRNVPQRDVHPYSRFQIRGKGKQSRITTFIVMPLIPFATIHVLFRSIGPALVLIGFQAQPSLASLFTILVAGCQSDKPHRRRCSKILQKMHAKTDDMRPHRPKGSSSDPPIGWPKRRSRSMNSWMCFRNYSLQILVYAA